MTTGKSRSSNSGSFGRMPAEWVQYSEHDVLTDAPNPWGAKSGGRAPGAPNTGPSQSRQDPGRKGQDMLEVGKTVKVIQCALSNRGAIFKQLQSRQPSREVFNAPVHVLYVKLSWDRTMRLMISPANRASVCGWLTPRPSCGAHPSLLWEASPWHPRAPGNHSSFALFKAKP